MKALVLPVACALALNACAEVPLGRIARSSQAAIPHRGTLELTACKVPNVQRDLRCGTYHVYENRKLRRGRVLPLNVLVVPARSGSSKGPVFVLAGGPGEAATIYAPTADQAWEGEDHDIVLIDQRGTGAGNRLDCAFPGSDEDLQGYLAPMEPHFEACRQALQKNADLSQYSTPTAMEDVDEIRQALGYDKIIVRAGSYGSRAAMAYIKRFGQNVRIAYLTGLLPFENRISLYTPADQQSALNSVFEDCAADKACRTAYPNPEGDLNLVRQKLSRTPAKVRIKHPSKDAHEELILRDRAFRTAIFQKLGSFEEARRIPLLLHKARAGDFTDLVQETIAGKRRSRQRNAFGMYAAIVCSEDFKRINVAEIERETSGVLAGMEELYETLYGCVNWPMSVLPADHFEPFKSEVPTLLISGDRDPVTPHRWGEVARRSFPNSLHLTIPAAHSFPRGGCMAIVGRQFFRTGKLEGLDTSCIASMPKPPFALPPSRG